MLTLKQMGTTIDVILSDAAKDAILKAFRGGIRIRIVIIVQQYSTAMEVLNINILGFYREYFKLLITKYRKMLYMHFV